MFGDLWTNFRDGKKANSQVSLAIVVIVAATLLGCVLAGIYGFASRSGADAFDAVSGGMVALFAATGAFSVGGVLGLLFGSPRWNDAAVATKAGAAAAAAQDANSKAPGSIRPNTSLERIADWLTTMIVGIGLVHVRSIEEHLQRYGG